MGICHLRARRYVSAKVCFYTSIAASSGEESGESMAYSVFKLPAIDIFFVFEIQV